LHISQPTISRDIQYIYAHARGTSKEYFSDIVIQYQNTLLGLDEILKNLWGTIDNPKTKIKERSKAISLMLQCYKIRVDLLDSETIVREAREYVDDVKRSEKDIDRREKALEAYLERMKLTEQEVDLATDPQARF
jgi:hypothetical protein